MERINLIAVTALQLIIIMLLAWSYFKDRKDKKFFKSEIKRIDNKIKTFGCVSEETVAETIRRKNGFVKEVDKV